MELTDKYRLDQKIEIVLEVISSDDPYAEIKTLKINRIIQHGNKVLLEVSEEK